MYNDMGMKFSKNFGHRKIYWEISCTFAGTGIGMPMYPGDKFSMKFWSLEIWSLEEFPENAGSIVPRILWLVVGHILVSSS